MTPTKKISESLAVFLSYLNNFHSLEVVDRVSETQLQVGDNSNWLIWRLKNLDEITILLTQEWHESVLEVISGQFIVVAHTFVIWVWLTAELIYSRLQAILL